MLSAPSRFALESGPVRDFQLHLVRRWPRGGEAQACAAVWEEGDQVRLAFPSALRREGVQDPRPNAGLSENNLTCLGQLEDVKCWLDAVCVASTRCLQVSQACLEHPEWDLRCEPFDGGDVSLAALRSLVRVASGDAPLPAKLVRECVWVTVDRLVREEPRLASGQLRPIQTDDVDDLGVVESASGARVLVSVRHGVRPTQAASLGVLAHYRMEARARGNSQVDRCLLVLPELELKRPMAMTPRAAIANLDPVVLRDALLRLAMN